jgi:predicted amidohydrolase
VFRGLKIAAAQFKPVRGDINENTQQHLQLISAAAVENVDVVIFPELSLTGYEPDLASNLAFSDADRRWEPLLNATRQYGITAMIGAPVQNGDHKPGIGLFVLSPDQPICHYSKMHLHPGEEAYFTPGDSIMLLPYREHHPGLAICADTGIPSHAQKVAQAGASIYCASVLFSATGYAEDTAKLQRYADSHSVMVVMANFYGPSGGWNVVGQSAIWDSHGVRVAVAPADRRCLVIAQTGPGARESKIVCL